MYFVWKGCVSYVCGYGDGVTCKERVWIAEATLWTRWRHRGTLTATSECKLAVLDAKSFQDIAKRYKEGKFDPKLYAADFVEALNKADEVDDLTSLCARN